MDLISCNMLGNFFLGIMPKKKTNLFDILFGWVSDLLGFVFSMSSGILLLILFLGIAFVVFAICVLMYLLPAIALYKMAKTAGYKYPWLSFIPFANTVLEFILPVREFKLFFVDTKDRLMTGIVFIVICYFGSALVGVIAAIPIIGWLIGILASLAIVIIVFAMDWRKNYDLFMTYAGPQFSIVWSIVCTAVPFAFPIVILFIMNNEPDYGVGNYYKAGITEEV